MISFHDTPTWKECMSNTFAAVDEFFNSWIQKNSSTATKAFIFVAPLRFPRDPLLFPLPTEFSLVVRYRATQMQRKQTAAKATVVNQKIWSFSKNFSKAYRSITLQYLFSTWNFLAMFLRLKWNIALAGS